MYALSDYSYILPQDLIAQEAAHPHHNARLMVVDGENGAISGEDTFWNLDRYLGEDRVVFFNNSKVVRSRIPLNQVSFRRPDGSEGVLGEGEIFFLHPISETEFAALVRPGNKFKIGTIFHIGDFVLEVSEQTKEGRKIRIQQHQVKRPASILDALLTQHGYLPLPPYIEYHREKEQDYQTSFASKDGSVAAPTASLHFTRELLEKIKNPQEYITLHVGLGTFKGIDTSDIREYTIHQESIEVQLDIFHRIATYKLKNQKMVAVGTTVCRTLESLPHLWKALSEQLRKYLDPKSIEYWDHLTKDLEEKNWIHDVIIPEKYHSNSTETSSFPISFATSIYITPGYQFLIVDDLITNFHLPESSLLVLVSAFLGQEKTINLYRYAIEKKYRFYSFGDGMYIRGTRKE